MPSLTDPQLHTITVAAVYLALLALRIFAPGTFGRLPRRVQALPALGLGALVHLMVGDHDALREALWAGLMGAIDGLTAVGVHHSAKRIVSPAPPSMSDPVYVDAARASERATGVVQFRAGLGMICALMLSGCAGSFEETRGKVRIGGPLTQRCVSLDDTHRNWGAVAKTSGVVAGGLGALPVAVDMADGARLGMAGGALAAGALAAGAVVVSEGAADSWARECAQ